MINRIDTITENSLCTACGACSAICPVNAIEMKENTAGFIYADLDNSKCIHCEKCYRICPSNNQRTYDIDSKDVFHGKYLAGYIGYATDKIIRQKSQSGGIVTALLCYLLDSDMIDGAIVNSFNNTINRPQAVLATNKDEIIAGAGSYYTQSSVIKTVLDNQDKRLAAVTLGCQSESLYHISKSYKNISIPEYIIGLVCAGQNSGLMINDILGQTGCTLNDKISHFRFRDKEIGGWPGNISVKTDKKQYSLDKKYRHRLKAVYESFRCILCFDQMNIFSDIVVGDPWGISRSGLEEGYSVIIARTEKGKQLIENAVKDGAIYVEDLATDKIFGGQTVDGRHKTKCYTAYDICKKNNWVLPYNEASFTGIHYENANKKTYNDILKRLHFTRTLYNEKDAVQVNKMIYRKRRKIIIKEYFLKPFAFLRRCMKFIIRRLHI